MTTRIARKIEEAKQRSSERCCFRNSKHPLMVAARRALARRKRSIAARKAALKDWRRRKAQVRKVAA